MSLIHCSSNCLYQYDGYCELDNAAEITNCNKTGGCLHYRPKGSETTRNHNAEPQPTATYFH